MKKIIFLSLALIVTVFGFYFALGYYSKKEIPPADARFIDLIKQHGSDNSWVKQILDAQGKIDGKRDIYEGYMEMGAGYLNLSDYRMAAAAYENAVDENPESYLAFENLGKAYEKLGKREFAANAFLRALENDGTVEHVYRSALYFYGAQWPEKLPEYVAFVEDQQKKYPEYRGIINILLEHYQNSDPKKYEYYLSLADALDPAVRTQKQIIEDSINTR